MPRELGPVPPGYVVHQIGSTSLVLESAHARDLVGLRLADSGVREQLFRRAAHRGRGPTPSVRVNPDLRMVLRRYRHGGTIAALTGNHFLGPTRALRELEVCALAHAAGAPVPRVLCVVLWPVLGPLWSALIGTIEETQTQDLLETLSGTEQRVARCKLLREVGAAIRELHGTGVDHRDLQLRNVLVRQAETRRIVVIDFDRARLHPHGSMPASRRAANLGRLVRSAVKQGLWPDRFGRRELAALVAGYSGGSRQLRVELRGRLRWERLKLAAHRLSYRIRPAPRVRAAAGPPRSA